VLADFQVSVSTVGMLFILSRVKGVSNVTSFLVSNTVRVSSLPPATAQNPNPEQYTFVSTSSGDEFQVFPDPRGNTLGRGTEIILNIEEEEKEWLSVFKLKALMYVFSPAKDR
jgi:heat shock protein beta